MRPRRSGGTRSPRRAARQSRKGRRRADELGRAGWERSRPSREVQGGPTDTRQRSPAAASRPQGAGIPIHGRVDFDEDEEENESVEDVPLRDDVGVAQRGKGRERHDEEEKCHEGAGGGA